ncbi:MAG: DUF1311 domain-containing protein [Alphaproteobacteria bacterium]|nr:DUF1311 domain-containing protein [Alphaproteobacteria bacterium]
MPAKARFGMPVAVCLAALANATPPQPAHAFTEETLECLGKAMNAKERLACAEAELAAQTRALNTAVERAKKSADTRAAEMLHRSQLAWQAFRDANCNWMSDRLRRDLEAQRIERILCLANTTEVRVQEIEEYQTLP